MTRVNRVLPLLIAALLAVPVSAQQATPKPKSSKPLTEQDLATAKPGRDPNQPIDEEYTKKIKEYTTETFFLSPLVDYLPASKTRADAEGRRSATSPARQASCRTRKRSTTTCGCSRSRRRA